MAEDAFYHGGFVNQAYDLHFMAVSGIKLSNCDLRKSTEKLKIWFGNMDYGPPAMNK